MNGFENNCKKRSVTIGVCLLFIVAYTIVISAGISCLLNLLSIALGIAIDGKAVFMQFPRFIPFCIAVGFLALIALVLLIFFNIKAAKKAGYSSTIWYIQYVVSFILSLPMLLVWELIFDFLRKTF